MRRMAACALIALLASWQVAHSQTAPAPDPNALRDRPMGGRPFTPERLRSEKEAAATKLATSGAAPSARGVFYFFPWDAMSPAEFEGLARHAVFLISVWTQKPEWLPVQRVYIHADDREIPIDKVLTWKTAVDGASLTAKMYGTNREDGFYLVPGDRMLRKGEIVVDLSANQTRWVMMKLPSTVASADPRRFPNLDPLPSAKPDLKVLQSFIRHRFTGFPVPQSLQ